MKLLAIFKWYTFLTTAYPNARPYNFTSDLLGTQRMEDKSAPKMTRASKQPKATQGVLYLIGDICQTPESDILGDMSDLIHEVNAVVGKARSSPAPGSNRILHCSKSLKTVGKPNAVHTLAEKNLPKTCSWATASFVSEKANSKWPQLFQEIPLLGIEETVFWVIVAERVTQNILAKKYIHAIVTKGEIRKWLLRLAGAHR